MEQLFTAANHYYAELERIGFRETIKLVWFWIFLVFLCFVGWKLITANSLSDLAAKGSILGFSELSMIVFQFAFMAVYFNLQRERKKVILSRINKAYSQSFNSIDNARRFLLQRNFGRNEHEYLPFSDEITKAINYYNSLRNPFSFSASQALLLIYNPESKQRIYALLLLIASALTALSIRDGAGIQNIFEFFLGNNSGSLIVLVFFLTIFLSFVLFSLHVLKVSIDRGWSYLVVLIDGHAARNQFTLHYLQRDLLRYHRFVHLKALKQGKSD